jgi:hypothetical protein
VLPTAAPPETHRREPSHEINPRRIASTSRAQASDKVAELRVEIERVAAIERGFPGGRAEGLVGPALATWHREVAAWLERRGEELAAHGHRLRAQAMAAG